MAADTGPTSQTLTGDFTGQFTAQEPVPEDAIAAVVEVLRSGNLHRYAAPGDGPSQAARLERTFRDWQGSRYCLAVTSGGQALQIALRAAGVGPGDKVLMNAFTLAPVPGAIQAVGADHVLVEITPDLTVDFDDLAAKAVATGAKALMLSHMRGHLCDMDRLMAIAQSFGLTVIEDCAHTMGARWNATRSGNFGHAACFSAQSFKHINAGEGGLITANDPDFMARATVLSGSYMFYGDHGAGPDPAVFADIRLDTPNLSARLDEVRAAILYPQIAGIDDRVARWNGLHRALEAVLGTLPGIAMPARDPREQMAASSLQFRLPGFSAAACSALVDRARRRGVVVKWFGANQPAGYTSAHPSWRYVPAQSLPATEAILSTLFDIRLSLTFSHTDCGLIGRIIGEEIADLAADAAA